MSDNPFYTAPKAPPPPARPLPGAPSWAGAAPEATTAPPDAVVVKPVQEQAPDGSVNIAGQVERLADGTFRWKDAPDPVPDVIAGLPPVGAAAMEDTPDVLQAMRDAARLLRALAPLVEAITGIFPEPDHPRVTAAKLEGFLAAWEGKA